MPKLSVADLLHATGGKLTRGDQSAVVEHFEIDTRRLAPNSAFFALRGEHTDGHNFLAEAQHNGATVGIIAANIGDGVDGPETLIRVESVDQALQDIAVYARKHKLAHVKHVAITGSNGKTSTKELMAAGLAAHYDHVHRTAGNFNNHLGVPLSVLACPDEAQVAVLELAMNAPYEIAALTKIVDPDVGIITNVRAVHLAAFNSLEDIAAAKGELFGTMADRATAVYNIDNAHLRVQVTRSVGPRVSFGRGEHAQVRILELANRFDPGIGFIFSFEGKKHTVHLHLGGAHSAFNALAAIAGTVALGLDIEPVLPRLGDVKSGPGRCYVHHLHRAIMLVDDTYNSSPAALASVLETLRVTEVPGRKVLVMGDMLELGAVEGALHREAGKRAAACGVDILFSVGTLARQAAETARRSGVSQVHHFPDAQQAAENIGEFLRDGDCVLVKGSRSVHLERVVSALVDQVGERD